MMQGLHRRIPGQERHTPWGSCYEIPFSQARLHQRAQAALRRLPPLSWLSGGHPELVSLRRGLPQRALFVDLETCGFFGTPVFLVGVVLPGQPLRGVQWLARHWGEEPAVLYQFWKHLRRRGVLVSFNGKSFDWPMLVQRTWYHYPQWAQQAERYLSTHCDLLHHARRFWGHALPNCRLKTLERYVCRYQRAADDLPGWAIPEAYQRFVQFGEVEPLERILYHNQMDLLTLVELVPRVLRRAAA